MKRNLSFETFEKRIALSANQAAGTNNDDLQTPADVIHPNIHQNNGPKNNASPGNNGNNNSNNMHGIANNPGQSGNKPGGKGGFAQNLTQVHGGIDSVNKNA